MRTGPCPNRVPATYFDSLGAQLYAVQGFTNWYHKSYGIQAGAVWTELEYLDWFPAQATPDLKRLLEVLDLEFRNELSKREKKRIKDALRQGKSLPWEDFLDATNAERLANRKSRRPDALAIDRDGRRGMLLEVTTLDNESRNQSASGQVREKLAQLRSISNQHSLPTEWDAAPWPHSDPAWRPFHDMRLNSGKRRQICFLPTFRAEPRPDGVALYEVHEVDDLHPTRLPVPVVIPRRIKDGVRVAYLANPIPSEAPDQQQWARGFWKDARNREAKGNFESLARVISRDDLLAVLAGILGVVLVLEASPVIAAYGIATLLVHGLLDGASDSPGPML